MKTSQLAELLNLTIAQDKYVDAEITSAYTSDLLSDVMGNAPDECVFITIQAHKNSIAVATLKDCRAIIICNARSIPEDMIEAAAEENIPVFVSEENQFTVSGKLYQALNAAKS